MFPITRTLLYILAAAVVWEAFWKGIAMWRAARNSQPIWYVALLIINTVGLLPIIYLLLYPRDYEDLPEKRQKRRKARD